jgi:hypothetical protein
MSAGPRNWLWRATNGTGQPSKTHTSPFTAVEKRPQGPPLWGSMSEVSSFFSHLQLNSTQLKFYWLQSTNPLPTNVTIKWHLGSVPKSHFCDFTGKTREIGLSDLMTLFIDLGCLYCKQTQRAFNVFKNTLNSLKIDSVDQKLFKIQLTRVWEFLTRRWNAWHWKRHCVFTAGGERVNTVTPVKCILGVQTAF